MKTTNTIKTVSAIALLGMTLNAQAQGPVVTAFAVGGPATFDLDNYEEKEKAGVFGALVSIKDTTNQHLNVMVEPVVQYGSLSKTIQGVDLKASMLLVGLPVGINYTIDKGVSAFVAGGPALGVVNIEASSCNYYGCFSAENSESEIGVMGVAGVEYTTGNLAVRVQYQVAQIDDLTMGAPMLGIGYKF